MLKNKFQEEYFSDDDLDLYESNYDEEKFVYLNSNNIKYKVIDEKEFINDEIIDKESEEDLNESILECFIEINRYIEDNHLCLLEKCNLQKFNNFIKNYIN